MMMIIIIIIDNPFGDHRRPLQLGLSVCGKAILGIRGAIQEVLGTIARTVSGAIFGA